MKHSILFVIGGVILAALISVTAVLMTQVDRKPPVITFEYDIHYDDSESLEALLKGVSALDDKDGNVSDALLVESLIVLDDGETAKVTYAVKDHSNNVAKAYRIIGYSGSGESIFASSTELVDEMSLQGFTNEANIPTETVTEAITEIASFEESLSIETDSTNMETESTTVETESATEKTTEKPTTATNPDSPVIKLKSNSGSVGIGGYFNVAAYVESIKDNKDSREELYRRIGIEGSYNTDVPGDYTFYIYCIDTDRNASNKEQFVLHVGGGNND